ncbi:SHOCT-like domain-containing protein [Halothermothrix orenii]|uniref:YvlB/LiaX N-terminal domain-containing protein n=1 Tax=Halothermothrix orenii (strain H 168 / OCM 544 / DSM 9562) TaxID=373903 RepID=B8CVX6_HALOH|nr:hypothetical protein [Halothermothrix orenii]ACL69445.1 hypothetical protein Hore_06880 [Halothermothrix orenii H 168]
MEEERLKILKMVEEGKVSVEEANELLETMEFKEKEVHRENQQKKKQPFLKILVESEDGEEVDISIPLSLAKVALNFMPEEARETLNEQEINLEDILKKVEDDLEDGTLVNIKDGENTVLIKIER